MGNELKIYDTHGDELMVPAKMIVCPTCNGKGSHVNRAIDGNGLSREDFEEDPDFMESYMSGVYDVTCEQCKGKNVVLDYDFEAMNSEQQIAVRDYKAQESFDREQEMAELRFCGYL